MPPIGWLALLLSCRWDAAYRVCAEDALTKTSFGNFFDQAKNNATVKAPHYDPFSTRLDPEIDMNVMQIIEYWGYPAEEVLCPTADGHILTLIRMNTGSHLSRTRPPFLLGHGLGASADNFVLNPPDSSIAFLLVDAGFDVWLMNFRGSEYNKHDPSSNPKKWEFSFDEMIAYDLPAVVDAILAVTNHDQLYYIGHSQGTLVMFAGIAANEKFAKKIRRFFALAPIISAAHVKPPFSLLRDFEPSLLELEHDAGSREFELPTKTTARLSAKTLCVWNTAVCADWISSQGGSTAAGILNKTRSPVYFAHFPGATSLRNYVHWGQLIQSGVARRYDHGTPLENIKAYGRPTPPAYDFFSVHDVPIYLFSSLQDAISDPEDVRRLMRIIPEPAIKANYVISGYSHFDFLFATNLKTTIVQPILQIIREQDGV